MNMPGDTGNLGTEGGRAPAGSYPLQLSLLPLAPREIWRWRDLLLFLAFLPFALLISKFVVLIGYAGLRPFAGWHVKVDLVQANTIFLLVQQCVFYVFVLSFLFLLAETGGGVYCGWSRAGDCIQFGPVVTAGCARIPAGEDVQFQGRLIRHRRIRHQPGSGN